MSLLRDSYKLARLSLASSFTDQGLVRTIEPHAVTDNSEAVEDYDLAAQSALAVLYAVYLKLLKGVLINRKPRISALDLACGPAVFTSLMAKYFKLNSVTGLDLSLPMLDKANKRFANLQLPCEYSFYRQSITDLSHFTNGSFDFVTFMDAAHHLPELADVKKVFKEAERVCSQEGVIFIPDLVRPKSEPILKYYYNWASEQNIKKGLLAQNEDFYNSLHAAWTRDELASAIPVDTQKNWFHLYPRGFQYVQVLIGLPKTETKFSLHENIDDWVCEFLPQHNLSLWKSAQFGLRFFQCEVPNAGAERNKKI